MNRQHYCLFEVDGDACKLQACDMGGQPFDTRVFTARGAAPMPAAGAEAPDKPAK